MANNQMVLVNHHHKIVVPLAKYYPTSGWYLRKLDIAKAIGEAFDSLDDLETDDHAYGAKERWAVAYETDDCWNDMTANYRWIWAREEVPAP